MSGLPAIATPEIAGGANLTPVNQVQQQASLTTERGLFEYLAQQSITSSLGSGTTLANPSALATQLTRHLRGFMENAAKQAETNGKRVHLMSQSEDTQSAKASHSDLPEVHAGPARQQLAPSETSARRTEATGNITDGDYNEIIDALTRSMHLMIGAEAIITGSGNITKAAQTLMRGQ
jgi:hypothetical protein